MKTKTKLDLVKSIAYKQGLTMEVVREVVEQLLEELTGELAKGNRIELRQFGVFRPHLLKGRDGAINPRNGQEVPRKPDRLTVKFKPGAKMKDLKND